MDGAGRGTDGDEGVGDLDCSVAVEVGDDDRGARTGKALGAGSPEAAAGAGDDGSASAQVEGFPDALHGLHATPPRARSESLAHHPAPMLVLPL